MFVPKFSKRKTEYLYSSCSPAQYIREASDAWAASSSSALYSCESIPEPVSLCSIPSGGINGYDGSAMRFIPTMLHKAERYAVNMALLDQEILVFLLKSFGCARKVYNLYVDFLYDTLEKLGYKGGCELPDITLPEVTAFKKVYPYLKEVDSLALANAKQDFEGAVKRFNDQDDKKSYTKRALRRDRSGTEALSFRGLKGMPKFHSKAHGDFSYTTNCQYPAEGKDLARPTIRLEGTMLHLPKLKKDIPLVIHRHLPKDAVIGNVTMSMDTDGRIFASVEYTYTIVIDHLLRNAARAMDSRTIQQLSFLGLDYSNPNFYVDSEGRTANYPHYYQKAEKKLAREQRKLSHMEKGSKNYERQLLVIQKLHRKTRDQRKDFVCKEASRLAKEYDVIVVEDIDLRVMGQCLSLGKNLHDNGFGLFRDRLAQKLEEKGSVLVKIDKWFASSKICHCCGYKNKALKLKDREWTCPVCGAHHMRDDNAAINIREEGKRIFLEYFGLYLAEREKSSRRAAALKAGRQKKKAS